MFFDLDNDGWPDLIAGERPRLSRGRQPAPWQQLQRAAHSLSQQWRWNVHRHLRVRRSRHHRPQHRRAAWPVGDLWNDGKISIVISNMNDEPSLLVNQIKNTNHWIAVHTVGTKSNRDGIGARISGEDCRTHPR